MESGRICRPLSHRCNNDERLLPYSGVQLLVPPLMEETDQQLRAEGCTPCAERLARAYATGGYHGWLEANLVGLKNRSKEEKVPPFQFAELYTAMGNADMAMEYLEKGFEEHTGDVVRLQVTPAYDDLHSDPRYQELIRRIGLPL